MKSTPASSNAGLIARSFANFVEVFGFGNVSRRIGVIRTVDYRARSSALHLFRWRTTCRRVRAQRPTSSFRPNAIKSASDISTARRLLRGRKKVSRKILNNIIQDVLSMGDVFT